MEHITIHLDEETRDLYWRIVKALESIDATLKLNRPPIVSGRIILGKAIPQ